MKIKPAIPITIFLLVCILALSIWRLAPDVIEDYRIHLVNIFISQNKDVINIFGKDLIAVPLSTGEQSSLRHHMRDYKVTKHQIYLPNNKKSATIIAYWSNNSNGLDLQVNQIDEQLTTGRRLIWKLDY